MTRAGESFAMSTTSYPVFLVSLRGGAKLVSSRGYSQRIRALLR